MSNVRLFIFCLLVLPVWIALSVSLVQADARSSGKELVLREEAKLLALKAAQSQEAVDEKPLDTSAKDHRLISEKLDRIETRLDRFEAMLLNFLQEQHKLL